MGLQTESVLTCSYTEAVFLRSEPTLKGDALILYFAGTQYMVNSKKKMRPQESIENLTDIDLLESRGTHSFKIPIRSVPEWVRALKPRDVGILEYGHSNADFTDDKGKKINFTKMHLITFKPKNGTPTPPSPSSSSSSSSSSSASYRSGTATTTSSSSS